MPRPPAGVDAKVAESLADDPDVQAATKALALEVLKFQVEVMRHGTGAAKLVIARSYGPMLAKAMAEQGNRGGDELRAEFRALMGELASADPVASVPTRAPLPRTDAPR